MKRPASDDPKDTAGDHPRTLALDATSFRLMLDSVRDYAIFMLDPQGRVASWNSGAERIKGYRADEIIGRHFSAFYLPEDIAAGRPEHELATAAAEGRYEDEWWRKRKDGSRFRANVVVTALRDEQGRLIGFAKITRDITERWKAAQALRDSEQRFRILIGQIADYAIFMLDAHGRVATWNLGAERIKGYKPHEIIGRPQSTFYPTEDVAKAAKLLRQAETEGVAHDIGWRMRRDGSRIWADVTLTALHDDTGNLYGYAKVTRDLTKRVEAEERAAAYEATRRAIRLRDDFLSIAAHELRTPLAAGLLHLQGLQRYLARDPEKWKPERVSASVKLAIQSSKHLAQLVETLLDVSRITTGNAHIEPRPADLAELTRDVVDRLEETAVRAGCELRVRLPGPVHGRWDRLRVEQALTNLISNACKYAAGSPIDVELKQDGGRVRLRVKDQGPGIAAGHLERIFGRFERAVSDGNYGGLGLGLYITRQIAEAHGGSIVVESELGVGSAFTIELPLWAESESESEAPPVEHRRQARPSPGAGAAEPSR